VRFIRDQKVGDRTTVATRVQGYKEIGGSMFQPSSGDSQRRPVWREKMPKSGNSSPPGTFDQARWNDIPIPK
jgi:hypothetical protein